MGALVVVIVVGRGSGQVPSGSTPSKTVVAAEQAPSSTAASDIVDLPTPTTRAAAVSTAVTATTSVPAYTDRCPRYFDGPDRYPIEPCQVGPRVEEIQTGLMDAGYSIDEAEHTLTGLNYCGPATATAVGRFQQSVGLPVTCIVDALTWKTLAANANAPFVGYDLNDNGVVDQWEFEGT